RINDGLAASPEAIAVGIAGMQLLARGDRKTGNLIFRIGFQFDEFDRRGQRTEIDREARGRVLSTQCLFENRMTAVNADHIAGYVCRAKEWEPHDVVPMHV